jgi:hypothetical protein
MMEREAMIAQRTTKMKDEIYEAIRKIITVFSALHSRQLWQVMDLRR